MKQSFTRLLAGAFMLTFFSLLSPNEATAQYCVTDVAATSIADEYISNVSYGTFSNPSGINVANTVTDFTGLGSIGTVNPGIPTSISVSVADPFTSDAIYVYIDANGDGAFTAADLVASVPSISNATDPSVVNLPFTLPFTAIPGLTRMRVKMVFASAVNDPCVPFTFGEVEDYLITVSGTGICTPPNFAYSTVSNCPTETYDVNALLNSFGDTGGEPNFSASVVLTRSDGVEVDLVTLISVLQGQTVPIIQNVPLGVTVTAQITGFTLLGNFEELCVLNNSFVVNGPCPPTNLTPCTATVLSCESDITATTVGALTPTTFCDFSAGSPIVYYTFTNTSANTVLYSYQTCNPGTNFDSDTHLFTGSCESVTCSPVRGQAAGGTNVGYVDGQLNPLLGTSSATCTGSGSVWASGASVILSPGQQIYIGVNGFSTTGTFRLTTTCEDVTCENPTLSLAAVNATGEALPACVAGGTQFFVQATITGGTVNTEYTVTANNTGSQVVAVGNTVTYGPYNAGVNVTISAVGTTQSVCTAQQLITAPICIPGNDLCANAIPLTCGVPASGTTIGATQETSCSFGGNRSGVWHSIQVDQTSQIQLETCLAGTSFNTDLSVFTGSCEALSCFAGFSGDGYDAGTAFGVCTVFSGAAGGPTSVFTAAPGVTYYIMVSGTFSTSVGNYTLQANCTPILCDVPTLTLTTQDGAGEPLANVPCLDFAVPFFVNAALSGGNGNPTYNVTASGTGFTTITQVVNANSNFVFGPFNPGTVVNISAVGIEQNLCGASGSATIAVCPAVNDLCADALPAVCGGTYGGTTVGATNDPAQAYCGTSAPSATNGGVWYEFTLSDDAAVDIDLSGSLYDTKVFLYSGTCAALTCVTGDDDGGDGLDSRIQTSLTAGTYYIYISGFGSARGQYTMSIGCVNAACSPTVTATAVADLEGTALGECVIVGTDYFVSVTLDGGSGNDFYNVTVNGSEPVSVVANGTAIVGPVLAGTAANVSAVGVSNNTCSGTASVNPTVCPPTNDLCADAVALTCGVQVFGTTINGTQEASCSFNGQRTGVWYSITVDQSSQIQLETCYPGTTFNTDISVFTGTCEALTCFSGFGGGDGYDGGSGVCAVFTGAAGGPNSVFTATPGQTYLIMVSGTFSTSVGNFALQANCTPILCTNPVVTATLVDAEGEPTEGCLAPGSQFFVEAVVSGGALNTSFTVTANNTGAQTANIDEVVTFGPYTAGATVNINAVGIQNNLCSGTTSIFGAFCSNDLACGPYSATPNLPIGPGSGVITLSTIEVTGTAGQVLTDLDVVLTGTHTFLADMDVFLVAPSGLEIPLFQDQCGAGDNFDVRLDDDGATFACGAANSNPILLGVFKPQGTAMLATFNGSAFDGTWTLRIVDDLGGDGGNLASWCLIPTLVTPDCDVPDLTLVVVDLDGTPIDGGCVAPGQQFSINAVLSGGAGNTTYALTAGGSTQSVAANSTTTFGPFGPGTTFTAQAVGEQDAGCVASASINVAVCPPTNDFICDAQAVECGSLTPGSLVGATLDNAGTCTTSNSQPGVWYSITPAAGGEIVASTCGNAPFDTKISVFTADACDGTLTCVGGNDDACGLQSTVTFDATGSTTYYILVHSFSATIGTGQFSLSVTCTLAEESSIAGTVNWNSNCGTRNAVVTLYTPNTNTVVNTYPVVVQPTGSFEVLGLTAGTYDVIVKVQGYLAKGVQDVVVGLGATALPLGAIINGDVNNNNSINLSDVSLVNASFGSTTTTGNYNPIADLNCSGNVNLADASLLNAGFLQTGAVAPL